MRFLGGLGGLERGDDTLDGGDEGGKDCRLDAVLLLRCCGAGLCVRRVVTTTFEDVDATGFVLFEAEKKLRSEEEGLEVGEDNMVGEREQTIKSGPFTMQIVCTQMLVCGCVLC